MTLAKDMYLLEKECDLSKKNPGNFKILSVSKIEATDNFSYYVCIFYYSSHNGNRGENLSSVKFCLFLRLRQRWPSSSYYAFSKTETTLQTIPH